ncbi:hypothetical protein PY365_31315 [Roseiarcaceae bacterium H3SJ34-1]|uniref:hypothetical protein n=1 Tax=Terripilifer ovatus TaxID=3032367 RepID=UPI003AB93197|nr:hypothetical protein [Roseiarcaceae bacterium H3SJ34-1]
MQRHSAIYGLAGAVALVVMSALFTLTDAAAREHSGRQAHAAKQHLARHLPGHVRHAPVMPLQGGARMLEGYGPVAQGAPVVGAPFGYSGCYGSREQIYVAGQGLVWRPRVDCPYKDFP